MFISNYSIVKTSSGTERGAFVPCIIREIDGERVRIHVKIGQEVDVVVSNEAVRDDHTRIVREIIEETDAGSFVAFVDEPEEVSVARQIYSLNAPYLG